MGRVLRPVIHSLEEEEAAAVFLPQASPSSERNSVNPKRASPLADD